MNLLLRFFIISFIKNKLASIAFSLFLTLFFIVQNDLVVAQENVCEDSQGSNDATVNLRPYFGDNNTNWYTNNPPDLISDLIPDPTIVVGVTTGTTFYADDGGGTGNIIGNVSFTVNTIPNAPVAVNQNSCDGATVADLVATGTDIKWHTTLTGGTALDPFTVLTEITYYASQTTNGCKSDRTAVDFVFSSQEFCVCEDSPGLGTATIDLTAYYGDGTTSWYEEDPPVTLILDPINVSGVTNGKTFYADDAPIDGIIDENVTFTVNSTPAAPTANDTTICNGDSIASLVATGTDIRWYAAASGGIALDPSTLLVDATTYYASQTVNGCESDRTSILVTVTTTTPPTASPQNYCIGTTVLSLVATGTDIKWYSSSTGGIPLNTSILLATGTYHATQTLSSCESDIRTSVAVTIEDPAAPTGSAAQTFCTADVPTIADLAATGTSILWYAAATGGTALPTTDPLVNATTYYATQTIGSCESSIRFAVTATINPTPTANDQNKTADSDDPGGNTATIDLTTLENDISAGTGMVSWFSDAALNNAIGDPAAYEITDGSPVYALVNNGNCTNAAQVVYDINSRPNTAGLPATNYDEDQTVADFNLSTIFSDPEDGSNLIYSIENITVAGILNASISGNLLTISLIANQFGTTTITIRATDTDGAFVEDDLDITVDPINDLPASADNTVTTDEDTDYTFSDTDFAFTDVETPSLVSITLVSLPAKGQLLLNNNPVSVNDGILVSEIADLTFSPDADEFGNPYTTFLFTVSDGTDDSSPANTLSIEVTPVNDAPTSADNTVSTDEDTDYTFSDTDFAFTDIESPTLTSITIVSLPLTGLLQLNGSNISAGVVIPAANIDQLVFSPDLDDINSSSFLFTVSDGTDDSSPANTLNIDINPINDSPSFDLQATHTSDENDGLQTVSGFASNIDDGDPEENQSITFTLSQTGTTGIMEFDQTPAISPTGVLTYLVKSNTNGSATFDVFCADDGTPAASSIVKNFTIDINPVNGPPAFTLNGDPPSVNEDPGAVSEPDFALNIDDGDQELSQNMTFNLVKTGGSLLFNTNPAIDALSGELTYTPATNSNGSATYSVTLSDDGVPVETSTAVFFTITVNPINDAPTGSDETKTINEDANYTFQVSDFTFSDIDSHTFSGIQIIAEETDGELKYNGADVAINQVIDNVTQLTYAPTPNESNDEQTPYATFQFKVRDSSGDVSDLDYTYTINVNPINDTPTSTDANVSTDEGVAYTFSAIDFPFSDVDIGQTFDGIRIRSLVNKGSLKYNNNDVTINLVIDDVTNLIYTPVGNENGSPYTDFDFQVRDNQGTFSLSNYKMEISVGAVNDRPTGADEEITIVEDAVYTFATSDFTFNDVDNDTFLGIQIISEETEGDLEYNGNDVSSFDFCPDVTKLVFKPTSNENGSPYASFKFKVRDNSGSLDLSAADYTMTINVTPENDPPTFTINSDPPTINEDAGAQTIDNFASAINDGDPELNQNLTFNINIESTTGNLTFASNPAIDETNGRLTYEAGSNTFGSATVAVVLQDDGGGQNASIEAKFTITVDNINDPPTLNAIPDPAAINEDAGAQTISLSGITAGTNESQPLVVSATSANTALIPNPVMTYSSPNTTGQLKYTPLPNINGAAVITVTVDDGQSTNNMITRTFEVKVNAVNDPPTINPITNPAAILENAGEQTINFAGVSSGGGPDETIQVVVITAKSNNTTLIPNPVVSYDNSGTGQLTYAPLTDQNGVAIITVTLNDGQSNNNITIIQFTVNVTSVNNPPALDDIADPATIDEDAGQQTISLSGIAAGGGENQVLKINVSSDNQQLISNGDIIINYISPATTGSIKYAPRADQFGSATITVSVDDGGNINNIVQKQFTVSVNPIADTPTATNAIANGDDQTTDGLVISRSSVDGTEVNHMKITNIINGSLFLNDGSTPVNNGEFISTAQGAKGLKFTPTPGIATDGFFDIQAATGNEDSFLGGAVITDTIFYNSFPESVGFSPILVNEDSLITPIDLYDIFNDPDDHDSLLTFVITLNANPELFDSAKITDHTLDLVLALNQNGSAELTIKATDPNGASVTDNLSITVLPINDAPILETPPVELGTQGILYEYNIVFNDPENEIITIDTLSLPSWLTFENLDNGTARIFGTPVEEQVGVEHSISLFAMDTNQDSTKVNFVINIQNTNDLPYFTSIADSVIEVGDFYDYLITADDPDKGDVLSFSIELLDGADIYFNYIDNKNGTATIFGTPPSGSIGYYNIVITVKDLALDSAQQSYSLRIKKANNIPELSTIGITINEDVPHNFSLNDFRSHFSDQDGDTIQNIKIVALPLKGTLLLDGNEVSAGDTIDYPDISKIIYSPKENDSGIDIFQWNAFDGTDYALIPANVNINIIQINDPPEILDFDTSTLLFEFGNTDGIQITEGTVFDGDGDKITKAIISFKENYVKDEDAFLYDTLSASLANLSYVWEDSAGVLTITGIEKVAVYTEAINFLKYLNDNPLSPNLDPRTIEIVLYDADTVSASYLKQVEFENNFVELDIPTGFTPNDDQVNDTWNIKNIDRYEDTRVLVYSRTGLLLFESFGYLQEWDGTYNGEILPAGPYYFVININKFQRNYTGTITILR